MRLRRSYWLSGPHALALTMACDLAYQRWLSSLEGRDLRTQSTKKNMEGRGGPHGPDQATLYWPTHESGMTREANSGQPR